MAAMIAASALPATIKCRIGVDDQDEHEALFALVEACAAAGVTTFVVHARKAWLNGLSPKENRDIPPLNYDLVYALKEAYPHLTIIINGGIAHIDAAQTHLTKVDGVMLGRTAYHEPALLGQVDGAIFGEDSAVVSPFEALETYRPYMAAQLAKGVNLTAMTRHMLGIMHGLPGARAIRRILTVEASADGAGLEVLDRALAAVRQAQIDVETRRSAYTHPLKDAI
jgi:tRNA-dihydrouridine synthase A